MLHTKILSYEFESGIFTIDSEAQINFFTESFANFTNSLKTKYSFHD